MHAVTFYHVPSLFSFRTLTSNALASRTLIVPTPAGVKLAALAALIRRDGGASAEEHLTWLAPLPMGWAPPRQAAVTAMTVRVYKSDSVNEPLTLQVGLREYAHFGGPFGLALLDVPVDRQADVEHALDHIRHLGVAESLVQPLGPVSWVDELPRGFILLAPPNEPGAVGDVTCVVDDLGGAPSFARLSTYRPAEKGAAPRLGEDRRRFIVRLPLRTVRRGADSLLLEALSP